MVTVFTIISNWFLCTENSSLAHFSSFSLVVCLGRWQISYCWTPNIEELLRYSTAIHFVVNLYVFAIRLFYLCISWDFFCFWNQFSSHTFYFLVLFYLAVWTFTTFANLPKSYIMKATTLCMYNKCNASRYNRFKI